MPNRSKGAPGNSDVEPTVLRVVAPFDDFLPGDLIIADPEAPSLLTRWRPSEVTAEARTLQKWISAGHVEYDSDTSLRGLVAMVAERDPRRHLQLVR
jgi:hypothetical protein